DLSRPGVVETASHRHAWPIPGPLGRDKSGPYAPAIALPGAYSGGFCACSSRKLNNTSPASSSTSFTVSMLTVTTLPTNRAMYGSSSRRLGSLVMPLRLSVLTWY
ncbi:MAG: hypothetical protein WCD86_20510, partial [Ktedonobacteraceae bacterium]